jgi:hypothetical protein
VYVKETCPEESVVPLDAESVPEDADSVMVLLETGEPLEVSVNVRVVELPEESVKLEGEIESEVDETGVYCSSLPNE